MCVSIFLFINMLFRAEYYNEYSINRLKTVLLSAMGGVQWCIKRRLLPDMGCNSRQELDSVFKELSLWKVKGDKNQRQKSKNWEDAVLQDQGASEKLHRKKTLAEPLWVDIKWQADSPVWGQGVFFPVPQCGHLKVWVDQRPGKLNRTPCRGPLWLARIIPIKRKLYSRCQATG